MSQITQLLRSSVFLQSVHFALSYVHHMTVLHLHLKPPLFVCEVGHLTRQLTMQGLQNIPSSSSREHCVNSESCHDFNSGSWALSFPSCLCYGLLVGTPTHIYLVFTQLVQPPVIAPRATSQVAPEHAVGAQHWAQPSSFWNILWDIQPLDSRLLGPYSRGIVGSDPLFS